MTPEELKAFLESEAGKAAVTAAAEASVTGLKNKNAELLGVIAQNKVDGDKIKTDLEALKATKTANDDKDLIAKGDFETLKKNLEERHTRDLAEKDKQIDTLGGQLKTHVLGEGLTNALSKANVGKDHLPAVKALINTQFEGEIGDNDGSPFAKYDGKAVDDFVASWVQSDTGKHYVLADGNGGGGTQTANGQGKATTGKTMSRTDFDGLPMGEQAKLATSGEMTIVDE